MQAIYLFSYQLFILYLSNMPLSFTFKLFKFWSLFSRCRHLRKKKLVVFKFYSKFDKVSHKTERT